MPHAKFHADLLKTMAMHKEQRTQRQTHRICFICIRLALHARDYCTLSHLAPMTLDSCRDEIVLHIFCDEHVLTVKWSLLFKQVWEWH